MQWFFTADLHFNHANIIKYCKRPFLDRSSMELCDLASRGSIPYSDIVVPQSSVELMNEAIVSSINKSVGRQDSLVVLGDFLFAKKKDMSSEYGRLRSMINCENVYLILGNHDCRDSASPHFKACWDNYLFKIDGRQVFCSHYPARSWDRVSHGAYMLYGHVHNGLWNEDNGRLGAYSRHTLSSGFEHVLRNRFGQVDHGIVDELLSVCESLHGHDLTMDVGVDNQREGVPFGTPWSMSDISLHMEAKRSAWEYRRTQSQFLSGNAT
jgi:calcineurin-like phosphoesterase family protein